jgi:hypothetical protein
MAVAIGRGDDAADITSSRVSLDDDLAQAGIAIDTRERFVPVTRHALIDRLCRPTSWRGNDAVEARRFFRYLDFWRQQQYAAEVLELEQDYEPFSPDSDLLITRKFEAAERAILKKRVVKRMARLLEQANYTRIDPKQVELILTKDSHYGLDLHVDLGVFEECLIYYRGASLKTETRRDRKKFYLKKEQFDVPIFQRFFLLFKLKPEEVRVREIMAERKCDQKEAEKIVRKLRGLLPPQVKSDFMYMKLFKNIPRTDIEMCFPNTKIKFKLFDKLKLGVTAGGGLGMGVIGTASKIAVATNPIALAGALVGLSGVAIRQASNFFNQRNRYMVTMAQNLYFHAMADNRGVMAKLADRAAEEDIKEEMLLYSILAKDRVNVRDIREIDVAIEQYLFNSFGVTVNFDISDALGRLVADGIVRQLPDGTLETLPPHSAAEHIDHMWDGYLDKLAQPDHAEGEEFDAEHDDMPAPPHHEAPAAALPEAKRTPAE